MKKVLLVSPYSKQKAGGISTWTKNILDYDAKQKEKNIVFFNTFFKWKPNIIQSTFHRVLWGVFDSLYLLILLIFKTIYYQPQTVHYTSSASFALVKDYLAAKWMQLKGSNFVIHWHFGRIPELYEKQNIEWKLLLKVVKAAKTAIVLDPKSLEVLRKAGLHNVILIPNPISEDLEKIAQSVDFKTYDSHTNDILFVGHIIPAKGIRELCMAFCDMKYRSRLILIGPITKEFKDEITALFESCDKADLVSFTSELQKEEVFSYMKKGKVLCLPSYTEGFPNVILEAMAVGCPVIATNVGAVEEMIASPDYGPAGICIEPRNVRQLIDGIEDVLSHPDHARIYAKNGNQRVLEKYTLKEIFLQYKSLWQ